VTSDEVMKRLEPIVAEVMGLDAVTLRRESTAADVEGWDSVRNVELMVALEDAFGVRFRTGELAGLANVGELADRIASRVA
jgi:acyl carrier protein